MNTFNGIKVVTNPLLTKAGSPIQERRSWKDRLFTLPWRPWVATRTVVPQIPSDQVLLIRSQFGGTPFYLMHPVTLERLRLQVSVKEADAVFMPDV